jgi:hypothetical protein
MPYKGMTDEPGPDVMERATGWLSDREVIVE